MKFDELMSAWQSQDAAPLHSINETLLLQALRREQVELKAHWRKWRWIVYVASTLVIGLMAGVLLILIYDNELRTDWEFAIPIVGTAGALLLVSGMYVSHRTQAQLKQSFGESLRDQLRLHIAQVDYEATGELRLASVLVIGCLLCATAITLVGRVINRMPVDVDWAWIASRIFWCAIVWAAAMWLARYSVQSDALPRKRRLEALLKELDDQ